MTTIAEEKPFVLGVDDFHNINEVYLTLTSNGWTRVIEYMLDFGSELIAAHYYKRNKHGLVVYSNKTRKALFTKYLRFVRFSETDIIVRSIPE